MTEPGPRLLRTLSVPVGVVLLLLLFTPKLCHRSIMEAEARRAAPAVPAGQTSTQNRAGLIIQSTTPAPRSAAVKLPDGLDVPRVQYLVEINDEFGSASSMAVTDTAPITRELLDRQYVQKDEDGTYTPTSDGLINVTGATDSSDGWSVPIARRRFSGIEAVEHEGDGQYRVTIRWRWEPTAIGATVLPHPTDHQAIAEIVGGEGHWALARWIQEPDAGLR